MDAKKRKILITTIVILVVLFLITAITVATVGTVLFFVFRDSSDEPSDVLIPDYPPTETDPNQSPIEGDVGGSFETIDGKEGLNVTYEAVAKVDLSDGKVKLHYANPSKSTQDIVVTLVYKNVVICRSQRITRGHQITSLPLEEGVKEKLEEGVYEGAQYLIGCYDPDTNEKAVLEVVIDDIKVEVTK